MSVNNSNSDFPGQDAVSSKKMIFYAFGSIISMHLIVAFDTYIFYFYEVEVGLPVLMLSLAVIIYTLWALISSPIIGYLTDRPFKWSKKYGFRLPWIIFGCIPSLLLYILVFTPPNTNPWSIFWYLIIIACFFETFFTIYRLHYSGLYANLFREDSERKKATVISFLISNPITLVLTLFPLFIIVYGNRNTFVLTALITVAIMFFCHILTIPGIIESDEMKKRFLQGYINEHSQEKVSFSKIFKVIVRNKNFIVTLTSFALTYVALMLYYASMMYFYKDILRVPLTNLIWAALGSFLTMTISMPLWNKIGQKHEHKTMYIVGLILSAATLIPFLWITTLTEFTIIVIIRGVAMAGFIIMFQPMAADNMDEITLKCERHVEPTLSGLSSIIFRSSAIFIALIIGWIHIATNYNPNPDAIQTPLAVWGVRVHTALIPMLLLILAFIVVLPYDLNSEKKQEMKQKMREMGL